MKNKLSNEHDQNGASLPRFAYFGTPEVASKTLEKFLENGFVPSVVITSLDARKGRGLVLTPTPVKILALAHDIPVITPQKLDEDALNTIHSYRCDYALVVAYGKIFPQKLIDIFPSGVLNIHYSLLPKYRGATPLESALLSGEQITGVTIQKMVFDMDAGDIVAQEEAPITPTATAKSLRGNLIEIGANLLLNTLPKYLKGEITLRAQDASQATFTKKIQKKDGMLNLTANAKENWNKYRAYDDSTGTYFFIQEKRVKIVEAEFAKGEFRLLRVIPEGKREISYADFAKSNHS